MTETTKSPSADWLRDLPLAPGAPDLRMGTRSLDVTDWLPVDDKTAAEIELRRALLAEHGSDVARIVPGHETALTELTSLIEIHLQRRLEPSVGSPIEQLAVATAEDILLMWRDEKHWRLIGGTLLFPNQWTLDEKIGKTLANIHAPVDGYDELLEARMDQFFDRLSAARPVWRRNWFFHDDPNFYQPNRLAQAPVATVDEVDSLFIRSEWQTLRRLAFSGLLVFTVKTQVAPIAELKARPAIAEQMCVFIESATPRSLENKDATDRDAAILDYLRSP